MTSQTRRGKTFKQLVDEAKGQVQEIDQATLKQWLKEKPELMVVDVREPSDFENGHIENAVNIPRGLLELEIDEIVPDQERPIVAYCGGGSRSALAAQTLQVMGYGKVYSLIGGYRQWVD
jgi:rhodanese-related sulfurtransferase